MSSTQQENEVKYKIAVKLLTNMLNREMISHSEYKKIDDLNRQTFSPELSKVYV